jgi:hypothetical protein
MCRAVARHLIPSDATFDIQEGLLDDDGEVYQRGPTAHLTTNQLGTTLAGLWEAQFSVGRRLLGLGSSVGVVDAAGSSWVTLSTAGALQGGGLAAQIGDVLFVPVIVGGLGTIFMYGGSRKAAPYSTGTVTIAGAVVTGAGTAWTANVDPGMILSLTAGRIYGVVKSVDSDTQVTLTAPWPAAVGAATGYTLAQGRFGPTIAGTTNQPMRAVAAVGGRLLVSDGHRVLMSNTIDQDTGASQFGTFSTDDFHEFPADVVGMATLRDTVFVFTKAGIWTISNVALPIVDAYGNSQHRVQRISGDVVLRSPGGVAPWRDSLLVCAVDGVYTMDPGGLLDLVSRSITPLWQELMSTGSQVGQVATFRDHAFVPVGSQVLVGRLDRKTKSSVGVSAPWTRFVNQGAEAARVAAFAVQDPYGSPRLVGGAPSLSGYLVDLTGVFGGPDLPAAAGGQRDGNGGAVSLIVETRDYVIDAGAKATIRDFALDYESTDGLIHVGIATGPRSVPQLGPDYSALASTAPANYASSNPRVFAVGRAGRSASFLIFSQGDVTGWRLRALRLRSRVRGRRR